MNRLLIFVVLTLAVFLVFASPQVDAQGDKPTCDPSAVIKKAAALTSTGDAKKDMAALNALGDQIRVANIACNGMTFQKSGAKIVGPIDLPAGTFKTTVTTKSMGFIAELRVTKGSCTASGTMGASGYLYLVMNIEQKQVEEENLIDSQGCTAIIVTSNVTGDWTLTIEPLQ